MAEEEEAQWIIYENVCSCYLWFCDPCTASRHKDSPTNSKEFLLLGLPIQPEHQNLFYALFLAMYLTTVLGNLLIITLICLDSHLHTPMYLFLSNLSFSDLCFSSVTMPKLLQNMQSEVPSIPYAGCLTQIYFFLFFGDLGNFILVAMAYDRYVAICFPCTIPPS
ncbi:Hypothetical predicted protein [Marmota monax]|uniref:G-protein coupled receptors family 1 profile domain-containing protein n=1 Tax=Marmota monax TaxID=9995 RepID=A0A5E4CHB5_MARMO|nr:Hypothetical predicted protein [Marmota monax]